MVSHLPLLPTLNASLGIPVASLGFSKINLAFATALLCGVTASSLIATASFFGAVPAGVESSLVNGSTQNGTLVTSVETEPAPVLPTNKPVDEAQQIERQLEEEKRRNLLAQERAAAETQRKIAAEQAQRALEVQKQAAEAGSVEEPDNKDDIGLMIAGLNQDGDVDDLISTLEETGALPDLSQEPYSSPTKGPTEGAKLGLPLPSQGVSDEQAKTELDSLVASLGLTEAEEQPVSTTNQSSETRQPGLVASAATAPSLSDLTARLATSSTSVSNRAGAGNAAWNARFGDASGLGALNRIVTQGGTPVPNSQVNQPAAATPVNRQPTADGRPRSFALSSTAQSPSVQQPAQQQVLSGPALQQAIAEYGKGVSESIRQSIRYPASLVPERIEGTVELGLIFAPNGSLSQVLILNSSKNTIIDENAVATVRNIRFPTPPAGATPDQLRFGIKMSYSPPKNP